MARRLANPTKIYSNGFLKISWDVIKYTDLNLKTTKSYSPTKLLYGPIMSYMAQILNIGAQTYDILWVYIISKLKGTIVYIVYPGSYMAYNVIYGPYIG